MQETIFSTVIDNRLIAEDIYSIKLHCPQVAKAKAGQFLSIFTDRPSALLPRPLSICDIEQDEVTVVYRDKGEGTAWLASRTAGAVIRLLGPLGNGFDLGQHGDSPRFAICGGGIGTPPMLLLTKRLRQAYPNAVISAYTGFREQSLIILQNELAQYADSVLLATEDGSVGLSGLVTDFLAQDAADKGFTAVYACGATPMLKALSQKNINAPLYISLEERMACTIGACLACIVRHKEGGYSRICKEGPVYDASEVY